MKIIRKTIIVLLVTLGLTSCGFSPIHSKKNLNFQINKIEFEGNRQIKAIILSNLKSYKKKEKDRYNYDLIIKAEKKVEPVSKNKKGETTVYKLNIDSIVKISLDGRLILTKNFNKSSTYLSEKNTLKLKEVEYRTLSNLSSKLADEIILTLSLAK